MFPVDMNYLQNWKLSFANTDDPKHSTAFDSNLSDRYNFFTALISPISYPSRS